MKTIWKYVIPIADEFVLELPLGARFLAAQTQVGDACLWAMVDPAALKTEYRFCIFGTGHRLPDGQDLRYIGTFQDGPFIWHLFWRAA